VIGGDITLPLKQSAPPLPPSAPLLPAGYFCCRKANQHTSQMRLGYSAAIIAYVATSRVVCAFYIQTLARSTTNTISLHRATSLLHGIQPTQPEAEHNYDGTDPTELIQSTRSSQDTNDSGDFAITASNMDRRKWLSVACASALALLPPKASQAYTKSFPDELEATDEVVDSRKRRVSQVLDKEYERTSENLSATPTQKVASTLVWGTALWFLAGSRSNPLVTPLASVFYDETKEKWLKDRKEGLFADVPIPIYLLAAIFFVAAGYVTDSLLLILAGGDVGLNLQLAGVSLISGGALELGRIASGEKNDTREESDRSNELTTEFIEFADKRLKKGGNCHRTDVIRAFRRFYAKYRQADNPDYPLSDLEIERLIKTWGRPRGIEMSSAGFLSGVQVNTDADVFVSR
jgi:hypothetical protein